MDRQVGRGTVPDTRRPKPVDTRRLFDYTHPLVMRASEAIASP